MDRSHICFSCYECKSLGPLTQMAYSYLCTYNNRAIRNSHIDDEISRERKAIHTLARMKYCIKHYVKTDE